MNSTRIWTLMSVLVITGLVLGTWFLGISPRLSESAAANDERATVEALNTSHRATLASLKEQYEGIDELREDLEEAQVAIPDAAELSAFISQLYKTAVSTEVSIMSVKFGDPVPYAPIENTEADPQLAAALQSVAPENFLVLPVDLELVGEYGKVTQLIASLQSGERLFLIHDLQLTEGVMGGTETVSMTASGQAFVLLDVTRAPAPSADGGAETSGEGVPQ